MNVNDCSILQIRILIVDLSDFMNNIHEISDHYKTTIILFDADKIAGKAHVYSALRHALRAWNAGSLISNSLEMEALLYASGTRQCNFGMQFGVHEGLNRAYLCICPENALALGALLPSLENSSSEDWESISDEKLMHLMELFCITNEELVVTGKERVLDLILERVALLEVYR